MTLPPGATAALVDWLCRNLPGVRPPLSISPLSGGRSNLTYVLRDSAGCVWVLRRPPLAGLTASAHDMAREWQFLSALAPTGFPVPGPVLRCDDRRVLDSDFYVMTHAQGIVLPDAASGSALGPAERERVAVTSAQVLAQLHAVDVAAVGLTQLVRPGSFIERQLRRWGRQLETSRVDRTLLDVVQQRLLQAAPPGRRTVVHGDYRPGNIAYDSAGRVQAVFDWELAAVGDPLTDVAWLLASWSQDGDVSPPITPGPTEAGGFPRRDVLLEAYARAGGDVDESQLLFYVAFARWRAACIAAGVHARYAQGAMGEGESDDWATPATVTALALAAERALDGGW